jgi:hypothetical protein
MNDALAIGAAKGVYLSDAHDKDDSCSKLGVQELQIQHER